MSQQIQNTQSTESLNLEQKRLNSEADRELENVLLNANQWYKASTRTSIPREQRKAIRVILDVELRKTVECLRDIREHWEDTRQYFENKDKIIPSSQSKILWFKNRFPNANPWSSGMSVGVGYYIGGPEVLNLHDLLVETEKVASILKIE